ncbi:MULTISPECIES: hypothetical protein [Haloarcula]|uniref:hypothetical protein n=1 Tax=Haloarcula TaxID=2237 RepID=UPI0023E79EB3|nr:hypothetical protein [Halomicroarcula sp. SHR3]
MNRRKFIIGTGAFTAAGTAAIGTGAFTSVEAKRTLDVSVADDTDALLALVPKETPNSEEYVEVDETTGTLSLDFTETEAGGQGLNRNADTVIDDLFEIRNQGTQEVVVGITDTPDGMSFYAAEDDIVPSGGLSLNQESVGGETGGLPRVSPGKALTRVGVRFQGLENDLSSLESFDGSVTINAYVQD